MENKLIQYVLALMELSYEAVFSMSRKTELVKARQLIHFFAKNKLGYSLKDAAYITKQEHATAINSISQIEDVIYTKWEPYFGYYEQINSIEMLPQVKIKYGTYITHPHSNISPNQHEP